MRATRRATHVRRCRPAVAAAVAAAVGPPRSPSNWPYEAVDGQPIGVPDLDTIRAPLIEAIDTAVDYKNQAAVRNSERARKRARVADALQKVDKRLDKAKQRLAELANGDSSDSN